MDLLDSDLLAQMIENQAKYEFRLAIIEGIVIVSAVVLMVTVLAILLEDFFSDR